MVAIVSFSSSGEVSPFIQVLQQTTRASQSHTQTCISYWLQDLECIDF